MNTIPTTFKNTVTYTAIGGHEGQRAFGGASGVSVVVLNRGVPYPRAALFEELETQGFDCVISLEGSRRRYDLDGLAASFPSVRFILPSEEVSHGEEINIAALELPSPFFLVIWDDLRILRGGAARMAERFRSFSWDASGSGKPEKPGEPAREKPQRICTVPEIQDGRLETIPTLIAPLTFKNKIRTVPFVPEKEGQPTLFPFDGIGLYDRESFLRLGGFDRSFKSFYWQLMDFGFRAWLWGGEIAGTGVIKLSYESPVTPEDSTADESFRRFYLKNLAPVFRGDYANLPWRRFPGFFWQLKGDILTAWEEFSLARSWIKTNRYRFQRDAKTVTELWGNIQLGEAAL